MNDKKRRVWLVGATRVIVFFLLVVVAATHPYRTSASTGDFEIIDGMLIYYRGVGGTVIIPDGVTTIYESAFRDCTGVTSIELPEGITSIERRAFAGCSNLTSIDIPASVINIELGAFSYCENLSRITVNSKNQKYDSRNDCNAIIESQSNTLIAGCSNTVIPEGVSSIATFAFEGSKQLDVIDIPEDVKNIGDSAFYQCSNLTRITLPQVMSSIGGGAFAYCTSLLEVRIPEGITSIEPSTFSMCTKLMKVSLPSSLRSIGAVAFSDCCSLTSVDIPDGVTSLGWEAFISCNNLLYISLPATIKTFDVRAIGCDSNTRLKRIIYFKGYYDEWEKLLNRVSQLKEYKEQVVCFLGDDGVIDLGKDWNNKQLSCWYVGKNVTSAPAKWSSDSGSISVTSYGKVLNKTGGNACTAHIQTSVGPLQQVITVTSEQKQDVYVQEISVFPINDIEVPIYGIKDIIYTIYPANPTKEGVDIFVEDPSIVKVSHYAPAFSIVIKGVKAGTTNITIKSKDGHAKKTFIVKVVNKSKPIKIGDRNYNFDPAWFEGQRSSEAKDDYNQYLAQFCSLFCMYGYREHEVEKNKYIGDKNILESILKQFNFSIMDTNIDNIDFEEDYDKVKFFIAKRDDRSIGGKVYIFAGFIGSYGHQWHSNFDPIGKIKFNHRSAADFKQPVVHSGFNDARIEVENILEKQIASLGNYEKEDLVCIFTGHSRGAATANLVAADFINGERKNTILSADRTALGYTIPDNVYAYTFATPNNILDNAAVNDNHNKKYDRIYNFVNPEDFVTYMIPEIWGYTKYGTTYSFPAGVKAMLYKNKTRFNLDDVKKYYRENKMIVSGEPEEVYNMWTHQMKPNEELIYKSYGGEKTVADFVKKLATGCGSIYDLYEKKDYIYYDTVYKPLVGYITVERQLNLSVYEYFQTVLCPLAYDSVLHLSNWSETNLIRGENLPGNPSGFFVKNQAIKGYFADAHEMETYDAFLFACPQLILQDEKRNITELSARCPVDIEVVENETGDIVARIENNVVDKEIEALSNSLQAYVEGDNKVVYIPDESMYTIRIIGNGDGVLDIVKTSYDEMGNELERRGSYSIPVSEKYELVYENGEEEDNDHLINWYGMSSAEIDVIEEKQCTITAIAEGEGMVYGVGDYTSADYICLIGEPSDGYVFDGWYQNDTLLSKEKNYYFTVKDDADLVAVFACEHNAEYHAEMAPSCTEEGKAEFWRCTRCGRYFGDEECTETVEEADLIREATGHTYCDQVTKKPSYMLNGICTYTCTKCTDSYEETIPRLDLPFTDVKKTGWQASTVRFMLDNLLMSGVSATKFAPDSVMNRGQLVAILWNMEGKPKVSGTLAFTDVPTTNTFYKAILWASQNKVINGYANGTFGPKDSLTRQQIATILMNYAKYRGVTLENNADLSSFKDAANVSKAMVTSMQWAVGNKIISGKSSGTLLDPKGMATRIEVAAMVMNYCKNIK